MSQWKHMRTDSRHASQISTSNNVRSPSDDQKWALLLIQNANLSADPRNAVLFQLTTTASMRKQPDTASTVCINMR